MLEIKENFNISYVPKLTEKFMEMQKRVTDAYAKPYERLKPDLDWIEEFICEAYLSND